MKLGYQENKTQADRAREALKVFQIATIEEIAQCLILSRSRVSRILNFYIPEVNKMDIQSVRKRPYYIFFLGGVENIEGLINKKYKSVLRKAQGCEIIGNKYNHAGFLEELPETETAKINYISEFEGF